MTRTGAELATLVLGQTQSLSVLVTKAEILATAPAGPWHTKKRHGSIAVRVCVRVPAFVGLGAAHGNCAGGGFLGISWPSCCLLCVR
jgi:hypothetical protein